EHNRMLLERLHGEERWENRPAPGWTVADLDAAEMRTTLEEAIRRGRAEDPGTRQPEDILRGLALTRDGQLLRAAVILFGKSERLEVDYPQCTLRVAASAAPTSPSSWTTSSSTAMPLACCARRSAGFGRPFP